MSSLRPFQFSKEMSLNDTNQVEIDLKPNQSSVIKLRFDNGIFNQSTFQMYNATIRMSVLGFAQRFSVFLIGFVQAPSLLHIDGLDMKKITNEYNGNKTEGNFLPGQQNYQLQLSKISNIDSSIIYKKLIKLENPSLAKLLIYPLYVYSGKHLSPNSTQSDRYYKYYLLDDLDWRVQLKIGLVDTAFNDDENLVWLELGPGQMVCFYNLLSSQSFIFIIHILNHWI